MKISKKLIGIGVASLGMVFSIGGAIALYTQAAQDAQFGISAGAYAGSGGTLTYKVNNTTGNVNVAPAYLTSGGQNGGAGLSATYTQVEYSLALGANFAAGAIAQDYVVGNLAVSLTNVPAAYEGKLAVVAVIDGYEENSLGEHYYRRALMPDENDYQITDAVKTFERNANVAVSANGTQVLHIYLKYNLAGIDTLTQNQAALGYTLNVTWGAPNNEFEKAYVMGNANQWTIDDGYSMAPNINKAHAEGWEWIYNNLPGTMESAKCLVGDKWSSGDNAALDADKTYTVYWNGSNESAASFTPIVVNP